MKNQQVKNSERITTALVLLKMLDEETGEGEGEGVLVICGIKGRNRNKKENSFVEANDIDERLYFDVIQINGLP